MKNHIALTVHCPLSHQDETVHVYYLDHGGIHIKLFTGCENTAGEDACSTVCKDNALNFCQDCRPGEPQVLPHTPSQLTDDPDQ